MSINKDSQKAPNLRFKGFTDDWEQRKLSDLIQTMRGGASIAPNDYKDTGVATVPKGAINPTGVADLSGSKYVSKNFFEKNENSTVTSGGLVTSLRDLVPSAPNMGRIVKVKGKCQRYLMPQGVYSILLQDKVDENFLISFSNTSKFRKIISKEKNGSTQVHIRNSEYLGITINTPGIEEQNQIGNFLKQLDNAITLHQRKLDQLNRLKAALLQQMFPGKGETVPKLRFAGFEGDWEERKLGEMVGTISSGNRLPKSELTKGNVPYIVAQTKNNGVFGYISENTKDYNGNDMKLFPSNSISFSIDNPEAIFYRNEPFYTSNIMRVIHNEMLSEFDYIFIIESMKMFTKSYDWSRKFSGPIVSNLKIMFPMDNEEQLKIGQFFKQLDNTITLQQRKLEQLQNMK